jgi:hypothetical protein
MIEYNHQPDKRVKIMFHSKANIVSEFNKGNLDVVAKQLKMYGNITKDKSFDVDSGIYAGSHRKTSIEHHGIVWEVKMHNGKVISVVQYH